MTQNPTETIQITFFNTKHTQNTKLHFRKSIFFKNLDFSKIRHSFESAFSAHFSARLEAICLTVSVVSS